MGPRLDFSETDESTATVIAGCGNELERGLDYPSRSPLRSMDDGTRDESTRHIPASAVKRIRLGLADPRSSNIDEGQQLDISDVYRISPQDAVCELTLRGRSVRKRRAVSNHRTTVLLLTSMVADPDVSWARRLLSTITEGRQSPTTASTSGLPCASPSRHALMPPSAISAST